MSSLQPLRLGADYNRWANARLYGACEQLSEADYRRDLGAFFRSVHGAPNHLLLGDLLWQARLHGSPAPASRLDADLCASLPALRERQTAADTALCAYLRSCRQRDLHRPLRYTSLLSGAVMTLPLWVALTHLSNHQIHHRGQATALLSRLGVDYGDIDLVWMPGVATVDEAAP